MKGRNQTWPEYFAARLADLEAAVADPTKGYPWGYGGAKQIAADVILILKETEAKVAELSRRPDAYECPCCGADGESHHGQDPDGDWWECAVCECRWSDAKRKCK